MPEFVFSPKVRVSVRAELQKLVPGDHSKPVRVCVIEWWPVDDSGPWWNLIGRRAVPWPLLAKYHDMDQVPPIPTESGWGYFGLYAGRDGGSRGFYYVLINPDGKVVRAVSSSEDSTRKTNQFLAEQGLPFRVWIQATERTT
jgi:hypothetical protein